MWGEGWSMHLYRWWNVHRGHVDGSGGGGGLASAVCWLPPPSLRGGSVSVSGSMGAPGWWVPSAYCRGWSGVLLPRGCCAGGCGGGRRPLINTCRSCSGEGRKGEVLYSGRKGGR